MTALKNQQPIPPDTADSVRTAPKATLLTAGEHLPPYPIIQLIHTLEKSKSEMTYQNHKTSATGIIGDLIVYEINIHMFIHIGIIRR